ncbi:MAG TPA: hypothetical protein VF221_14950, partial [Chloroflexota bacterium]
MTQLSTIGRGRPAREIVSFAAATLLGLAVGIAVWRERFEIVTVLAAVVATVLLLISTRWWRTRRVLAGTIVLNVAILFSFLWSLDEREHIVIHDVMGQYTGQVGTASVTIPQHIAGGRFGLYASPLIDYRVYSTGEAPPPQSTTLLTRFGEWMRLAFGPAWTNIHVTAGGKEVGFAPNPTAIGGSWGTNRRGEYTGTPGSSVLLGTAPTGSYAIEADLMRGDGTQGFVLGVDSANQGDIFAPRIDQPDMLWLVWSNGTRVGGLGASGTRLPLTPMIQRDLRLLLANVFVAQILLLFALPLYLVLLAVFRLVGGTSEDELRPV